MRNRALGIASIGLLLGITAGVADGAPAAKPAAHGKRKRLRHLCTSTPDKDKCLAPFYLDDCRQHREVCRDHVENELEAAYEANKTPEVTMFKPRATNIPVGLRQGKSFEYAGPERGNLLGTVARHGTTKVAPRKTAKPSIKPVPKAARRAALHDDGALRRLGSKRAVAKLAPGGRGKTLRKMTSDNLFSRTGLTRPPHTGLGHLPVGAHRQPAWDANGARVASCEEYAYEQMYDWARYTDAVAACAGDLHCQLDIAFLPSVPGIADRRLEAKDGTPLRTQIETAKPHKLPKNDFFAAAKQFAFIAGEEPLASTPSLEALAAALDAGKDYYEIGGSTYPTEWAFHRKLHDANRTVTAAEFEEYELRKAAFRELLHKWQWAAMRDREKLEGKRFKATQQWVSPIDMVSSNPFERMGTMQTRSNSLRKAATKMRKQGLVDARGALTPKGKAARKGAKGGRPKAGAAKGKTGGRPSAAPATPSAAPATPSAAPATPSSGGGRPKAGSTTPKASTGTSRGVNRRPGTTGAVQPTALMGFVPKGNKPSSSQTKPAKPAGASDIGLCHPKNFSFINELMGHGPLSCRLGQMIRQEWKRKEKGYKSCLDLDNDDCDWSPMMFESRFTKGLPYIEEQQSHEAYCVDWTGDVIDRPTLAAAKQYIDAEKAAIEDELEKLAPYQVPGGGTKSFGKAWVDADHFGDKAMFAAGYDYDLGWDITVVDAKPGSVCQLGAGARGGFGVDAWFIGEDFEIVDGRAQVDWNRNPNKKNWGDLDIHLRVFSADVFDPVDEQFQGAWSEPLFTGDIDIPSGYKPSFTVMAGFVPITGAVWGEFFYGAKFGLSAVSEAPNCDMSKTRFGVDAAFTPELGLNAKAQVGVGISGLVSAGVRGMVNLVTVGVPVTTTFDVTNEQADGGIKTKLGFDLDVRLSLATLSGWLAVYLELLFFEEEFVIFRWNGLGPESISLLGEPLHADLPLHIMAR